jgi:hypothetical protein
MPMVEQLAGCIAVHVFIHVVISVHELAIHCSYADCTSQCSQIYVGHNTSKMRSNLHWPYVLTKTGRIFILVPWLCSIELGTVIWKRCEKDLHM